MKNMMIILTIVLGAFAASGCSNHHGYNKEYVGNPTKYP
jgi:PBP1b-binding outer membrane lipoprotein LpoB